MIVEPIASRIAQPISAAAESSGTPDTAVIALVGQSNMVGRNGPVDPTLDATQSNILMLSGSSLVTASDPLDHFDETADTVGPGLSLAKRYLELNPDCSRVILVPAADGGTGHLSQEWNRIDTLYANAVQRVDDAMSLARASWPDAQLVMIAHHQGENEIDGDDGAAMTDEEFRTVKSQFARDFRIDLADADENTPIVFGGLSPDWNTGTGNTSTGINDVMEGLGTYVTKYGYADPETAPSLEGDVGDEVHYTAAACREMGVRMAEALSAAQAAETTIPEPPAKPAGNLVFHFDHTGMSPGYPLVENSGNDVPFANRRVCIVSGGQMEFRTAEREINRRIIFAHDAFTPLTDQDFSLRAAVSPDLSTVTDGGIVGIWTNTGDNRSWLLRIDESTSSLQFFYSGDGATFGTLEATGVLSNDVETEVEVRREGGTLSLIVEGVTEDSVSDPGAFFDVPDTDMGVVIGDHDLAYGSMSNYSDRHYEGLMRYVTLEYL